MEIIRSIDLDPINMYLNNFQQQIKIVFLRFLFGGNLKVPNIVTCHFIVVLYPDYCGYIYE
jgi:hypothetical protein